MPVINSSTSKHRPHAHKAAPSNATPINPSLLSTSLPSTTGTKFGSSTIYYLLGGVAILLVVTGGVFAYKKSQENTTPTRKRTK